MGQYDALLTREFLIEHIDKSGRQLEALMRETMPVDEVPNFRTINRYRKKLGVIKKMKVVDKKVPEAVDEEDYIRAQSALKKVRDAENHRQASVKIIVPDSSKYVGIVIVGDIHFGAWDTDEERLERETQLIEDTENVLLFQIGDIVNNETGWKQGRFPPSEYPMRIQRMRAKQWAERVADKLAAFIIGNHDLRSIIKSDYDIGNDLAQIIEGAYLGYGGLVEIIFENALEREMTLKLKAPSHAHETHEQSVDIQTVTVVEDLVYRLFMSHSGDGHSSWNPTHGGLRILKDRPHLNLDIVAFGHRHDMNAQQIVPYGDRQALIVHSGGYTNASEYAESFNAITRQLSTPVIILNPHKKDFVYYNDLETGIKILKLLNGDEE